MQGSEKEAVKRTLESAYSPEPIRRAREQQDKFLLGRLRRGNYRIADIGCGNGYHAVALAPMSSVYHGFEISEAIAETARELWRKEGLTHAEIFVGDVEEAVPTPEFYDVVLCLYFTPGNLRERLDDLTRYDDAYLDRNPGFIVVMSSFYRALRPGGAMFLTVYQDVPEAEAAQIDYYENTGQHVLTPPGSRFVATAEGFWSVRFTKRSMLSNLAPAGVQAEDVFFHELNAIAWLAEVRKPPAREGADRVS